MFSEISDSTFVLLLTSSSWDKFFPILDIERILLKGPWSGKNRHNRRAWGGKEIEQMWLNQGVCLGAIIYQLCRSLSLSSYMSIMGIRIYALRVVTEQMKNSAWKPICYDVHGWKVLPRLQKAKGCSLEWLFESIGLISECKKDSSLIHSPITETWGSSSFSSFGVEKELLGTWGGSLGRGRRALGEAY